MVIRIVMTALIICQLGRGILNGGVVCGSNALRFCVLCVVYFMIFVKFVRCGHRAISLSYEVNFYWLPPEADTLLGSRLLSVT
jgi:hypothetical protein